MPARLRAHCLLVLLALSGAGCTLADPKHRYDAADALWEKSRQSKARFDALQARDDARYAAQLAEIAAYQAAMTAWLAAPPRRRGPPPALSPETEAALRRHAGRAFDGGQGDYDNARTKAALDAGVADMEWEIERGQIETR